MATKKKTIWYVTATDKFLSGWGPATGKKHKLIVKCNGLQQALKVKSNMEKDRTLSYVNYTTTKPSYPSSRYTTKWMEAKDCPLWNK